MNELRLLREGSVRDAHAETMPHILLVVDQLPRSLGGGERIVLKLAAMLPQYGYRATILTFAAHPESAALMDPPCPVYLLPLTRTYDLQAFLGAFALRRFLREQRIALVHTCFESSDIWAGTVTKLLSRAKLVWNRRDMGILRTGKHFAAYKRLARMPDAVFAVAEEVRRYTISVDGVPAERVLTIHNGLDLDRWPSRKPALQTGRPRIATLGNVRRVKGHDVLLRAFARVREEFPDASLEIGGAVLEPEYMEELESLLREHALTEYVQFCGSIRDQGAFLADKTVFVLPSRSEGFSNAIVEAMAASLPVVATKVGGNAEAIDEGVTGYLVESEDVNAMAGAMLRLLREPAQAERMGVAGRERVAAEFTTAVMMRRVAATFDRLLA